MTTSLFLSVRIVRGLTVSRAPIDCYAKTQLFLEIESRGEFQ